MGSDRGYQEQEMGEYMKFEIKHRLTGNIIFSTETESWKLAVEAAIKSYADLSYANLRSADLRSANLRSANLRYADLRYADLSYANLSYADLSYAKGINKYISTPLMILYDQVGEIRAYKLVNQNGEGPYTKTVKARIMAG